MSNYELGLLVNTVFAALIIVFGLLVTREEGFAKPHQKKKNKTK
jgi:hypothetical protein